MTSTLRRTGWTRYLPIALLDWEAGLELPRGNEEHDLTAIPAVLVTESLATCPVRGTR